jgi:hypothetical protein
VVTIVNVNVIVDVIVILPVIVAVHVHGNDTVIVIVALVDDLPAATPAPPPVPYRSPTCQTAALARLPAQSSFSW